MRFDQVAALFKSAPNVGIRHEDAFTFESGNVLIKQILLERGQATVGHAHHYDHVTMLAHGRMEVLVGDESTIYEAPAGIDVKAGVHHMLMAHTDVVAYCIHDISKVDPNDLGVAF